MSTRISHFRGFRAAAPAPAPRSIWRLAPVAAAAAIVAAGLASPVLAAPNYTVNKVIVAEDQYQGERKLDPAAIFKPHETDASRLPRYWVSSNERTGCAGITVLTSASNKVLANLIIDEPDVEYAAGEEATGVPCVGSLIPEAPEPPADPGGETGTETGGDTETGAETEVPEPQFPLETRLNPTVCLPVVLPPGAPVPTLEGQPVADAGAGMICAPLGAESHSRHPHGIDIDATRNVAYQVIEHSGLKWNADRTAFDVAETTDEESGLLLAYDISNPDQPLVMKGWLLGHAAEEAAVNERNGKVFVGNHEDAPGVTPTIWVSVIDPALTNPYGFIDTGYFNAVQGIEVDEAIDTVFGTTHVGEKMFSFDASCVPEPNSGDEVPPAPPPGFALPAGDSGMASGWNCIKYWVDLRPAFVASLSDVAEALLQPPSVLHMHDLTVDPSTHRAYQSLHSIHDAEHTGLAEHEPEVDADEEAAVEVHGNGRWVVEVDADPALVTVDPATKQATAPVFVIDLSNGFDVLTSPNVEDILAESGLAGLQASFVHAHFLAVDPVRRALLVSGEHTGNLGVVDTRSRRLERVIPISIAIPGCEPPPPAPGEAPESEEPHVHGVNIQNQAGTVYVSDEGEHCFYESVTILKP